MTNTGPPHRASRRLSATQNVLAFSAGLALTAALLTIVVLRHTPGFAARTHVSWWMLAIGFAMTDVVLSIHLDIHRDTYTISLMEMPLVIGLFLANPLAVVVGRVVGAGLALAIYRRQTPLKLFFNLALFALEAAVALIVFRSLVPMVGAPDPSTWGPAFAAVIAANVISAGAVGLVIILHGGSSSGQGARFLIAAAITPMANTSLALGALVLLWTQPDAAWLLCGIAAVLIGLYRAYAALSQRYKNLQRLYEFTDAVQQAPQGDEAIGPILEAARSLLRAGTAELALLDGESRVLVSRVSMGAASIVGVAAPITDLGQLWLRAVTDGVSVRANKASKDGSVRAELAAADRKDVLIVPLRQDGTIIGTMLVADRQGDVASFDPDDLRFFETVVNHAAVALERSRLVDQLQHDALHDGLTGLGNRALFSARISEAIAVRPAGTKAAVMIMDLDRFKEVNDTLGHHHGDHLLRDVGARLVTTLGAHTTVARLGGDEFAILIGGLADGADAVRAAHYIRELISCPFPIDELGVEVGASIGIALCPDDGEDEATLLQRADVAMYAAKTGAGVELYASDRDHYSPRRLALVAELRQAIDQGQLEVHYQPQAELTTGRIIGVEALLRWPHPEYGFVPPDEFIPVAEHTGLIRPLTSYVVRSAVAQCRAWQDEGIDLHMSVNLSMRNLLEPELISDLRAALTNHGLAPSCLTLEVTESSIMGDPDRTINVLNRIADLGVGLSVDDFGTGYSSLTYLKRLPVNEVKIDKSFVLALGSDPSDAAIVRSVIDLGVNLGLSVVAEGVEDQATWDLLSRLGCHIAQGFHLTRALPADQFTTWLDARHADATVEPHPGSLRLARSENAAKLSA